jgi:hypothetical protein
MRWKILRRVMVAVVFLIIAAVVAGAAVLHLPALGDVRNRIAAELLASYLGEAVAVTGGVDLSYGQTIDVAVSGVSPAKASQASPQTLPVGTVRLSFARDAALRGRLELTELDLSGVRVIIDADTSKRPQRSPGESVSKALEGFLSSPLARRLTLEDVQFLRVNDPAGWNGALVFERVVTSALIDAAEAISVDARGSWNGQAFTLAGSLPALSPARVETRAEDLALTLAVRGLDAKLEGRLRGFGDSLELSARLEATSPSIGDLQELLQLARVLEGDASLSLALDGPLAELATPSGALRIETAGGHVYELQGGIGDLWSGQEVEADFAATFARADAQPTPSGLDPTPRAIKGRILGGRGGFEIDRVFVETGLASIQLAQIGPVRIGSIGRDADGRLRLEDIRLVQGDPKDPMLDFTARLKDALEFKGFSLSGAFKFSLAHLLTGRQHAADVGALQGELAASNAAGPLRLDRLAADLRGTDLLSFSLHLMEGQSQAWAVEVQLAVPDLNRLTTRLELGASQSIPLSFDGQLGAEAGIVMIQGDGRVGQTDLAGRMQIAAPQAKPAITGEIRAKQLYLDDIAAAHQTARYFTNRKLEAVELREGMQDNATLSLDISADRVEDADMVVDGLRAGLRYAQSSLALSVAQLSYLGARISGTLEADLASEPPALTLEAQARALRVEQLFRRLGQAPLASGPLDLDVAVNTGGTDPGAMLAALSGQVSGHLTTGTLADRTVNLAGQSIIEWVFTPSADGSAPIECLVARLDFDDGVGSVRQLVLETDKVQAAGAGSLNLRDQTMDLVFQPRPKQRKLLGQVGPVSLSGPFSDLDITLTRGTVAKKVVGDTIGLPFDLLRPILDADGRTLPDHEPCAVMPGEGSREWRD